MHKFIQSILVNKLLEKIDFSDNDLTDEEGLAVLRYIKQKAEERDNALWMNDLRKNEIEKISKGENLINILLNEGEILEQQTRYESRK